ncbi:MAG TPA: 3-isopropylmalate dehydratase/homoaconitate hydratase family large subunit [Patescibacteria group bacterium]|nr:3-isopropylmalate dehydratase/homoaconitate hydratase family large subunit [Gammaproteobacteria bacterium]HWA51488.1 3-isopropylmalate dehydratase/homoaconitate hydratase family large subunit [Patescibacteria group bacterium]
MNIYQKIIYNKHGKCLKPGKNIILNLDWLMLHDGSIMMVERYYQEHGFNHVFDPEKIIIVFDHIYPANNAITASLHEKARNFTRKYGIKTLFDGGQGISHQLLLENPEITGGSILLGGDSHTPTIGAYSVLGLGSGATDMTYAMLTGTTWFTMGQTLKIKLWGVPSDQITAKDIVLYIAKNISPQRLNEKFIVYEAEHSLTYDWRAVLCNMSPELGAVTAIFEPSDYYSEDPLRYKHTQDLISDCDNDFDDIIDINIDKITPLIAYPHQVDIVYPVQKKSGIKVDVVFIGTCTGGRLEDLISAAKVFSEMQRPLRTRLLINPASIATYKKAIELGLITQFLELGATILPPSCGPCLGQNMGVLGDNETCVSTGNRNYKGRMGNKNASIYLCSPASAARIAVEGNI